MTAHTRTTHFFTRSWSSARRVLPSPISLSRDHVWAIGLPAIEAPWRPAQSFDNITSRLVEGLIRVADDIAAGRGPGTEAQEQTNFAGRSSIFAAALSWAERRARRKVNRITEKMSGNAPKWHVAWRACAGADVPAPGLLQLGDFRTLDDGGKAYFADPFVMTHNGVTHVFVEEVAESTGRGIISHFTLREDGTPSAVTPVLDTGMHLSYPFVFEDAGAIWMLPESSSSGGLDLYRATDFPLKWEKAARLIEGRLHDATPFRHGGRWWIAAGSETLQSSSWDALSLFSADTLLGPWQAHPRNPVLIDAAAARPAGAVWTTGDGALMRLAQDCSKSYGGAIALRRIVKLDTGDFADEPAGSIAFTPVSGVLGPHTVSRGGGFEVIDLFARPSVLRAGYRS